MRGKIRPSYSELAADFSQRQQRIRAMEASDETDWQALAREKNDLRVAQARMEKAERGFAAHPPRHTIGGGRPTDWGSGDDGVSSTHRDGPQAAFNRRHEDACENGLLSTDKEYQRGWDATRGRLR